MKEIEKVFSILEKTRKPTMLELLGNYTHFQMLVMTLLSSRTKDSTTIPIVKRLFAKYPDPEDFVKIETEELEKLLYGIGFYRVKAKNIKKLSKIVLEKYHGNIPRTLEKLISLPGVGRKTANCVIAYAFNEPAIAVDIHVHRISNRLGWLKTDNVEETEAELQKLVPRKLWVKVNSLLVDHGQRVCLPINPKCSECSVCEYCEYGRKKLKI